MARGKRIPKTFSTSAETEEKINAEAMREGIPISQVINRALSLYFQTKMQRDNWQTDDGQGWYDPKKFYVGSEDRNGHSAQIRVWIPKNLAGQIGRLVEAGRIPEIRSQNDFARDALFHRAKQVAQWLDDDELMTEVDLHMMIAEEESIAQQQKDVDALVASMEENLRAAWLRGDVDWIENYLIDREAKGTAIPPQLRRKFDDIIRENSKRVRETRRLEKAGKVRRISG